MRNKAANVSDKPSHFTSKFCKDRNNTRQFHHELLRQSCFLFFRSLLTSIQQSKPLASRQQVSISSMFYMLLLYAQIPKGQKDTDDLTVFLRFWDLHV